LQHPNKQQAKRNTIKAYIMNESDATAVMVSFILTSMFDDAPASKMNEKTKKQYEFIENFSLQRPECAECSETKKPPQQSNNQALSRGERIDFMSR
jgi:hypothetical protein